MKPLLVALLLALAGPAQAQPIHIYAYEHSVVGGPVTLTGPGFVRLRIHLPPGVEGLMLTPHLKGCPDAAPIEDDESVHMHSVAGHPDKYFVIVKIADLKPGRTQTYCPRLRYVPRPPEPDALGGGGAMHDEGD